MDESWMFEGKRPRPSEGWSSAVGFQSLKKKEMGATMKEKLDASREPGGPLFKEGMEGSKGWRLVEDQRWKWSSEMEGFGWRSHMGLSGIEALWRWGRSWRWRSGELLAMEGWGQRPWWSKEGVRGRWPWKLLEIIGDLGLRKKMAKIGWLEDEGCTRGWLAMEGERMAEGGRRVRVFKKN